MASVGWTKTVRAIDDAAAQPAATRRRRRGIGFSGWHLFLAPVALLFLIPFVQMVLAALSPSSDLLQFPPPFLPSRLTLGGFVGLFRDTDVLLWLANTVIVSTSRSPPTSFSARWRATASPGSGSPAGTSGSSPSSRRSWSRRSC